MHVPEKPKWRTPSPESIARAETIAALVCSPSRRHHLVVLVVDAEADDLFFAVVGENAACTWKRGNHKRASQNESRAICSTHAGDTRKTRTHRTHTQNARTHKDTHTKRAHTGHTHTRKTRQT